MPILAVKLKSGTEFLGTHISPLVGSDDLLLSGSLEDTAIPVQDIASIEAFVNSTAYQEARADRSIIDVTSSPQPTATDDTQKDPAP